MTIDMMGLMLVILTAIFGIIMFRSRLWIFNVIEGLLFLAIMFYYMANKPATIDSNLNTIIVLIFILCALACMFSGMVKYTSSSTSINGVTYKKEHAILSLPKFMRGDEDEDEYGNPIHQETYQDRKNAYVRRLNNRINSRR